MCSSRDLDRERSKLEAQEKKIIADIKKMAKQGQMVWVYLLILFCVGHILDFIVYIPIFYALYSLYIYFLTLVGMLRCRNENSLVYKMWNTHPTSDKSLVGCKCCRLSDIQKLGALFHEHC